MISSFADQGSQDIFEGADTKAARKIPKNVWSTARRKLDQINIVDDINELRVPPGNRLEALKGSLAGFFNIRVNDQFRIVFSFAAGNAYEVQVTDYHH